MTSPTCSPRISARPAAAALALLLAAVFPSGLTRAQDAVASVTDFTIAAITYDDGWQTPLRNPTSLFFDSNSGELFAADAGNHRVLIYDRHLNARYSFEHFVREPRSGRTVKGEPRDLVVTTAGEIVLADNFAHYLEVLDFRGKSLEKVHLNRLYGDTSLVIKPQCLTIDAADNIYVATVGDITTVMVLSDRFELKRTIGQKGGAPSEFNTPLGMHLWRDRLYVTDLYANPAVKVFDTTGTYLFGFAAHDIARADMSFPSGLTVLPDSSGRASVWIVDGLRQVIKVFDHSGEFVELVGGFGINPGEFRYPADIAAAGDSAFFVLEKTGGRIQRFEIK
ncbi:MAG: NHL repeat-containing protein [Candidatus Zixiibacteriota bacterium]|nr:MAG: NHL repeat-containing protein [candidate division Zixibacteria bacterium]